MNDFIPDDHVSPSIKINLAPMIDFLFIMLCVYAVLAVSRTAINETHVNLVELEQEKTKKNLETQSDFLAKVFLGVSSSGNYTWIEEKNSHELSSIQTLQKEIFEKIEKGILPKEKEKMQILLHIDSQAPWKKIAELLFAIREMGYDAHPVYNPKVSQK